MSSFGYPANYSLWEGGGGGGEGGREGGEEEKGGKEVELVTLPS